MPGAIGVGYPEEVNLAFDAELCRLALIWQENFIDASRHWTGRGQGFEAPLGENLLELPEAIVFAKNSRPGQWNKSRGSDSPVFKGYHFDENRRPGSSTIKWMELSLQTNPFQPLRMTVH